MDGNTPTTGSHSLPVYINDTRWRNSFSGGVIIRYAVQDNACRRYLDEITPTLPREIEPLSNKYCVANRITKEKKKKIIFSKLTLLRFQ